MQKSRLHVADKLGQYLVLFEHLNLTDWSCSEAKHWRKYSNMKLSAKKENDRITFSGSNSTVYKTEG